MSALLLDIFGGILVAVTVSRFVSLFFVRKSSVVSCIVEETGSIDKTSFNRFCL